MKFYKVLKWIGFDKRSKILKLDVVLANSLAFGFGCEFCRVDSIN